MGIVDQVIEKVKKGDRYSNTIDDEDFIKGITSIVLTLSENKDLFLFRSLSSTTYEVPRDLETDKLILALNRSESKIFLRTSGTTGEPKNITHSIQNLLKGVVINGIHNSYNWGFCYSLRHISGLLMVLQAAMNNCVLEDLRNLNKLNLHGILVRNSISHISAPSTFFRMNLPLVKSVTSVLSVANGGEPMGTDMINTVNKSFPKAKIRNIYALSEAGSLLISDSKAFRIPEKYIDEIKIEKDIIFLRRSLVSIDLPDNDEWYDTGDQVKWLSEEEFEIIGRVSEQVKVLGHLVSIPKVESIINSIDEISLCRMSQNKHKVFGTILSADIILEENSKISKMVIREKMKGVLRDYEVPTKIKILKSLELSYSGKIKR
jgi:acyl-coenzyme A synthetase/AMP-(fatty) acid ligase